MSDETNRLYEIGNQSWDDDRKLGTTFEDKLMGLLCASGLFEDVARPIFEKAMEEYKDSLADLRNRRLDEYPKSLLATSWLIIKAVAREYLKEHHPKHFARAMFDEELLKELESQEPS